MFSFLKPITVEMKVKQELDEAQRGLLDAEATLERAKHNRAMYAERVSRLQGTTLSNPEESPRK